LQHQCEKRERELERKKNLERLKRLNERSRRRQRGRQQHKPATVAKRPALASPRKKQARAIRIGSPATLEGQVFKGSTLGVRLLRYH
jgi:hypothetical protein